MTDVQYRKAKYLFREYERIEKEFLKLADQINPLAFASENPKQTVKNWIEKHERETKKVASK
jgi:hypothetical protein